MKNFITSGMGRALTQIMSGDSSPTCEGKHYEIKTIQNTDLSGNDYGCICVTIHTDGRSCHSD